MKITKATFRSFLKQNQGKLFIKNESAFNGMIDMVDNLDNPQWKILEPSNRTCYANSNLGYQGIYLVGNSRDTFQTYKENGMTGFYVYNCCGSFYVAKKD